ncbi:TPA: heavy-metal-associated domain-containing protein [Streptococcus suis]|nr:heavy-metal-associated domain-containing protein [Streptococcus suis]
MKQTLKLKNLSCQNCVKHVTNHFLDLDGVEEVKIQLEEQLAEVETSVRAKTVSSM